MKSYTTTNIMKCVQALPPLPAAVTRLLELTGEAEADFQEIAQTIALDQALTAQILRIANSAFYGLNSRVRTVQQATVVLGRFTMRNLALGFSVVRLRERWERCWPLDPVAFWRHSIAVACAARKLTAEKGCADPEEAFVAGLMHDIGMMVLAEVDAEAYADVLLKAKSGQNALSALEREVYGTDHAAVGQLLCRRWNIPTVLTEAVAAHHGASGTDGEATPSVLGQMVCLADTLVAVAEIGHSGEQTIAPAAQVMASDVAVSDDVLRRVYEQLFDEVRHVENMFFGTSPDPDLAPNASAFERWLQASTPSLPSS